MSQLPVELYFKVVDNLLFEEQLEQPVTHANLCGVRKYRLSSAFHAQIVTAYF
jgi:hypothetical protein